MPPLAGKVLALDLSGTIGWCLGRSDASDPEAFGTWSLPKLGDEGQRYAAFEDKLQSALERMQPSQLVLEAPLRLAVLAQKSTLAVVAQQLTLRGIAFAENWRAGLARPVEVEAIRVRKAVLGRARFPRGTVKQAVINHCRQRGWAVRDDNAADACLTWAWYVQPPKRRAAPRRSDFLFDFEQEQRA